MIDGVDDDAAEEYEKKYAECEDMYIEVLSLLRMHIDEVRPGDKVREHRQVSDDEQSHGKKYHVEVKMPQQGIKNTWGKFGGDLTQGKGFHDRFVAAIHDNKDVSPAFKYHHLQKSLVGLAAGVLDQGAAQDGQSYEKAWERFVAVYDDKYAICSAHIHQLFAMPLIQEPVTADQLRFMTNTTHEQIRQLRSHSVPVESWDMIICTLLHDRLPAETARQLQLQLETDTPKA